MGLITAFKIRIHHSGDIVEYFLLIVLIGNIKAFIGQNKS